ncbi:MAG: CHASE domain-containing protein [Rhodobacteraceae bacterium]|nr:CHASE domain-containing protein [Paracoccaceae bacterium]
MTAAAPTRAEFEKSGRLHFVHYLVVIFSFVLTFVVWQYSTKQANARVTAAFDRSADQMLELITDRMQKYEDGLWSGAAMITASGGEVVYDEWHDFARTLRIDEKYPGINGIGVILRVRQGDLDGFLTSQRAVRPGFEIRPQVFPGENLPITYIEPKDINAQAVGLNMRFESNRFRGLMAARDSGEARITGPITLVQDAGATPGFLFYAPYYAAPSPETPEARSAQFLGAVYAPFVVRKLMEGVLDKDRRAIRVTISDDGEVIYDENSPDEADFDHDPMFTRSVEIAFYGRVWRFDIRTNTAFRSAHGHNQPKVILACGIAIDTLLLCLFVLLTRSNRRAIAFADILTEELRREKRELQASNAALEQYAYVSSHDLKTPIRSMRDVTDYLREDLEQDHAAALADPKISENLRSMRELTDRMEMVVKGVLDHAQIGRRGDVFDQVDPGAIINGLVRSLNLPRDRIEKAGTFPRLHVNAVQFSQIVANLLENARQHHPNPSNLKIQITGQVTGDDFRLIVTDNGPGIDPRYHGKIFEMFQSLGQKGGSGSTGIGLSIVRRAAEGLGGSVSLESREGKGAAFTVTLPGAVEKAGHNIAAE